MPAPAGQGHSSSWQGRPSEDSVTLRDWCLQMSEEGNEHLEKHLPLFSYSGLLAILCFHPIYLLNQLSHWFNKLGAAPRHKSGQSTGDSEIKKTNKNTESLPPQSSGGSRAMYTITEMKATDPIGIGWGLQDPRGGEVGFGVEPFWKVSQRRCLLSGHVA